MGEDTDLADFEYPMFGDDSLCFRLDSDFSIDSGVVTEQVSKTQGNIVELGIKL